MPWALVGVLVSSLVLAPVSWFYSLALLLQLGFYGLAGVGGCLIGYSRSQLSSESFNVIVGLTVVCMTYVCGITHISGAVLAGLVAPLGVFYTLLNSTFGVGEYYTVIAASALVLTAVLNPVGIVGGVGQILKRHRQQEALT